MVVKEVVANGRLTARAGETPFNEFARQHGIAPDALAIGAAVQQPWADIVLSGAITAEQLESNLAYRTDGPLTEFVQQPEEYWTEHSALPWISCPATRSNPAGYCAGARSLRELVRQPSSHDGSSGSHVTTR